MTTTDDTRQTGSSLVCADAFEVAFARLNDALDAVSDVPAWALSEEAVQARLSESVALRSRVEELTARLLASVTDREVPRLAGASSPRTWLMATHGMSAPDATRLVRETVVHTTTDDGLDGSATRVLPTRAAWALGRISAEQAVLIGQTVSRLSSDVPVTTLERLQEDLIGHAQRLSYDGLRKVCRRALEVVDPDGADSRLADQLEREEERALAGDPARGIDGADRKAMPYQQRLGRAWCELLEHLPVDGLPKHGVNTTTLLVTTSLAQLKTGVGDAALDTGTPLSPAQVRRLACNAAIVPIVLGGDSAILDLGMAQRLFDRHQRLALALRDGGCIWPGCDRPPAWCEAHHIVAWADGGPTDLANGCLLCPFHHHLVHGADGWRIQLARDGIPEVIPPVRLDPDQHPRRHERLTRRRSGDQSSP